MWRTLPPNRKGCCGTTPADAADAGGRQLSRQITDSGAANSGTLLGQQCGRQWSGQTCRLGTCQRGTDPPTARRRASGGIAAMSRPSMLILPPLMGVKRSSAASRLLLPAPVRPQMPTWLPAGGRRRTHREHRGKPVCIPTAMIASRQAVGGHFRCCNRQRAVQVLACLAGCRERRPAAPMDCCCCCCCCSRPRQSRLLRCP